MLELPGEEDDDSQVSEEEVVKSKPVSYGKVI